MYTSEDRYRMWDTCSTVRDIMDAVHSMNESMGTDADQTTMQCMDTMMVKAYNTLHEYVQYREQRMREEENG